jgi:hypothetical protein
LDILILFALEVRQPTCLTLKWIIDIDKPRSGICGAGDADPAEAGQLNGRIPWEGVSALDRAAGRHECSAYIPHMSSEDSKRARHRQWQARFEAALAGMASGSFRRASEDLTRLNYLPEDGLDHVRPQSSLGSFNGP